MEHSWHELFVPISGYLILIPKIILGACLAISPYYLPQLSMLLTWGFIATVASLVALAPTQLRGKVLCSLALFLVPSDAEVFGVALYTFWWAAIPLFLVALWEYSPRLLWLRVLLVIFGALSSPTILGVLPFLYFRIWRSKGMRSEIFLSVLATVLAVLQLRQLWTGEQVHIPSLLSMLKNVPPKFLGMFVIGNFTERLPILWTVGVALVLLIIASVIFQKNRTSLIMLGFMWVMTAALSSSRVDPAILHPVLAGPRYFFYPYVITLWLLIQLLTFDTINAIRWCAIAALLVSIFNGFQVWSRTHVDLHWAEHIRSARKFGSYVVPIQYDGALENAWSIVLAGPSVKELMKHDFLISQNKLEHLQTFAYTVTSDRASVISGLKFDGRHPREILPSNRTVDSLINGRADIHPNEQAVVVQLQRGDRLCFYSGGEPSHLSMKILGYEERFIDRLPVSGGWVMLEFANSDLPSEFTLLIKGAGSSDAGKWSVGVF